MRGLRFYCEAGAFCVFYIEHGETRCCERMSHEVLARMSRGKINGATYLISLCFVRAGGFIFELVCGKIVIIFSRLLPFNSYRTSDSRVHKME